MYKDKDYLIVTIPDQRLAYITDFKRKHSIFKLDSDKICYVVPFDFNDEKLMQLRSKVAQKHDKTVLEKEAVDLTTEIGEIAQKLCKDYQVVKSDGENGIVNLN